MTVDLDQGMGYLGGASNDSFLRVSIANQLGLNNWASMIFRALLRSEPARHVFLNHFADTINTVFQPDYVIDRIDAFHAAFELEMPEHLDRWNMVESMEKWEANIQNMRDFAIDRPNLMHRRVRRHFHSDYSGLPGEMFYINPQFNYLNITIENPTPDRGDIQVNTIDLAAYGYPWTGEYWRTIPLPQDGYLFDGVVNVSDLLILLSNWG